MSLSVLFRDRIHAGEQLAQVIEAQVKQIKASGVSAPLIVYALPRGGLPVAAPVARLLSCPLDIIVAKKITLPEEPELSIGAVTADGHVLWSPQNSWPSSHPSMQQALQQAKERAQAQLAQMAPYRPSVSPQGAIAIIVDDGIATGLTMAVATQALRFRQSGSRSESQQPAQVWNASPVAPRTLIKLFHRMSDRLILLESPHPFFNVSRFYGAFPQVELEEALVYLQMTNQLS